MTMQLHDFEGGKIWLDTSANEMQALMAGTQWEWRKVDYMRRHLQPGMTFADVGAFNGYFTLIAAKLVGETGSVEAFEPDDDCFDLLVKNLIANGEWKNPYSRIFAHRSAVGNTEEETIILYKNEQFGWSSSIRATNETFECNHTRLDDEMLIRLDMMKIDVEGAEFAVLRGATQTLSNNHPVHILMDLHPDLGVKPDGVETFLLEHHFNLFSIRDDFAPIDRIPESLVELLAVK